MFDILRRSIAKNRAILVETLAEGNIRERYDYTCGMIKALDEVVAEMTNIEKKLATAGETEDEE